MIAYWKVLDLMTEMASRRHTPPVEAYFRAQLAQRRETMLRIADDIGAALEREWNIREAELSRMYREFRATLLGEAIAGSTRGFRAVSRHH